jgi:hypothetical protein
LAIANLVVVGVAIACLFVARRAWALRDDALTALAQAQARTAPRSRPSAPTMRASTDSLQASTMDRLILCDIVGVSASLFFTGLLVTSKGRAPLGVASRSPRSQRSKNSRWRESGAPQTGVP